jgi:cell pole-organizing protein PopZ
MSEEGQEEGQEEASDETSMDDILANIRRVISEEDEEVAEESMAEPNAEGKGESMRQNTLPDEAQEKLDKTLATEPVSEAELPELPELPELEPMAVPEPIEVSEPLPRDASNYTREDDVLELTEAMIAPADELMSGRTTQKSSDVLGELARAIMERREMGLGDKDVTLEGMVREMMRPLLREWLDRNLPHLIERMVKKEIDKMVNRAEMFEEL